MKVHDLVSIDKVGESLSPPEVLSLLQEEGWIVSRGPNFPDKLLGLPVTRALLVGSNEFRIRTSARIFKFQTDQVVLRDPWTIQVLRDHHGNGKNGQKKTEQRELVPTSRLVVELQHPKRYEVLRELRSSEVPRNENSALRKEERRRRERRWGGKSERRKGGMEGRVSL